MQPKNEISRVVGVFDHDLPFLKPPLEALPSVKLLVYDLVLFQG
jgi:hypothetical protein